MSGEGLVTEATSLDYFGARYYSGAQGRFTSVDPIGASKQKIADPQQWNMYAYGRNNPLRFIDPTGRRVELVGDDEEREKQLEALKKGVGDHAATYLTVKKDSGFLGLGKTHYYVQTTDSKAFAETNAVAAKLGGIINDTTWNATIQFVSPGTSILGGRIGSADARMTPLATATTPTSATVYVTTGALGSMPAALMENHTASPIDLGVALIHEFGHVDASWYHGGFPPTGPREIINAGDAVRVENQSRLLLGLPLRTGHNIPF